MKTRSKQSHSQGEGTDVIVEELDILDEQAGEQDAGRDWQQYALPVARMDEECQEELERLRPFILKLFFQLQDSSLD